MRMVFTALPGFGLFLSTVPLAWAARAAGHEVLVLNNGPAVEAIAHAGLPVVDTCPEVDLWANLIALIREKGAGSGPPPKPGQGGGFTAHFGSAMSEGAVRIARAFKPDLIVSTLEQGAGMVLAADLGVPLVEHGIRLSWGGEDEQARQMRRWGIEGLEAVRERLGIARPLPEPAMTLDIRPPSMGGRASATQRLMRFVPYNGERALPAWVLQRGERPRLCLTLGSVLPVFADAAQVRDLIRQVAALDAEVVLVLGDVDPAPYGPFPENVRPVGWLPLNGVLPTCDVLVHHGGAGTALTALAYGVPQLVLPRSADQPANARVVAERGVGLALEGEGLEAGAIAGALARLLHTPAFREASREVQREIAAQPAPAELVEACYGLACQTRT